MANAAQKANRKSLAKLSRKYRGKKVGLYAAAAVAEVNGDKAKASYLRTAASHAEVCERDFRG